MSRLTALESGLIPAIGKAEFASPSGLVKALIDYRVPKSDVYLGRTVHGDTKVVLWWDGTKFIDLRATMPWGKS